MTPPEQKGCEKTFLGTLFGENLYTDCRDRERIEEIVALTNQPEIKKEI